MAVEANVAITWARELASCNNFVTALDLYLCAFTKEPRYRKRLMNEFLAVLNKMNAELTGAEDIAVICTHLKKAIDVFPGNVCVLNQTGSYLCKHGYLVEALQLFEKASNIDGSYVSVEKNLNNTKACLLPQHEFRILNDRRRNEAFKSAIRSCVTASDNVIDIDAGLGLLTLYASECGAKRIDGCETSDAMSQLAKLVRSENHAYNIVIENMPSMTLTSRQFGERKSVLLTDSIDAGLFGDNILQALHHAWINLLHKNSKIIPGKAEYFVVGVKCDELCNKYNLCRQVKDILNVTYMNVHPSTLHGETYCGEDIHLYQDIKYITEPTLLFTINFNRFQDIHEKLYKHEPYNAELIAMEDGEIDIVVGWFNLNLTKDIVLTNDPRSDNRISAYQQAVFFDFTPRNVCRNEKVNISFLTYGGKLTTTEDESTTITRLSLETVTYLNDIEFMNTIIKSVSAVCVHLGQTVLMEEVDVLDLSPFPMFGIQMMKRGARSLICLAKTLDDEAFLQTVLAANRIPISKVTVLVTEYWSLDLFKDKMFHIIFSQIIDLNGDVNIRRNWIVEHLKLCHLVPGGICLPMSVTMCGQLIYSNYLETNNRVMDENVGYRMAKYVNRYQVSQVMHLDIARLEFEALSNVFEVASCVELQSGVVKVPILKDGDCNAILCWYKVQIMDNWPEIYTNRSNSFVQSMAYMTEPDKTKVFKGDEANVLRCVDPIDGSCKLVLDIEP